MHGCKFENKETNRTRYHMKNVLNQANGSILILKLKMKKILCGNVLRDAHVWRYNSNNIVY